LLVNYPPSQSIAARQWFAPLDLPASKVFPVDGSDLNDLIRTANIGRMCGGLLPSCGGAPISILREYPAQQKTPL
jgi:hypothetical protein